MKGKQDYNPAGRKDNCGFCSISRAIHVKFGDSRFLDADAIYEQTLAHLGIERPAGADDPISRMLLLPNPRTRAIAIPEPSHAVLKQGVRSGDQYTVHSVAGFCGLLSNWDTSFIKTLNEFIGLVTGPKRFRALAEKRLDESEQSEDKSERRRALPSIDRLEQHLRTELAKPFIIGTHMGGMYNHFTNLTIDLSGRIEAYDAQIKHETDPQMLRGKIVDATVIK